jgi:hypothetical protein
VQIEQVQVFKIQGMNYDEITTSLEDLDLNTKLRKMLDGG